MTNRSFKLDYQSLIKLFPLALGINIIANNLQNADEKTFIKLIAFLGIFILFILDSIIEFSRFDYSKLPKLMKAISYVYTIALISLVFSFSIYFNSQLNYFAVPLLFYSLAFSSILEFIFSLSLNIALKKDPALLSEVDYDDKDTKFYCWYELGFIIIYFLLSSKNITDCLRLTELFPFTAVIILIIEIFVFNFLKNKKPRIDAAFDAQHQ